MILQGYAEDSLCSYGRAVQMFCKSLNPVSVVAAMGRKAMSLILVVSLLLPWKWRNRSLFLHTGKKNMTQGSILHKEAPECMFPTYFQPKLERVYKIC